MSHFNSLLQRILNWDEHSSSQLHLYGTNMEQWTFVLNSFMRESPKLFLKKSQLIVTSSNDEAEDLSLALQNIQSEVEILIVELFRRRRVFTIAWKY